jgi:hypothetical protein
VENVVLTRTDAWVFMAIGGSWWWCPLKSVVFGLDYLNRLMPTASEFEASVDRLGRAGLIKVSRKGYKFTRKGRSLLAKYGLNEGVITNMLHLMDEWDGLGVAEAESQFHFELKMGEWQKAQEDFTAWYAKRIARIKQSR